MPGLTESEALELFARCVAEIVGPRAQASRDMAKAVQSGQMVDLMLAQSSFDELKPELRLRISERVRDLVSQHLSGAIDATVAGPVRRYPE